MKRLKRIISALLCASLLLMPTFTSSAASGNLTVDFARIGDADAMLLGSDGHFMLVDTGKSEHSAKVQNMLKSRNVKNLRAVAITHYHSDHVGGFTSLLNYAKTNNITIDKVYGRLYTKEQLTALKDAKLQTYYNYINFLNAIASYKNSTKDPLEYTDTTGVVSSFSLSLKLSYGTFWRQPYLNTENFSIGSTYIEWLNEKDSYVVSGTDNEVNNDSLVFRATETIGGKSMMFLGDIAWNATKNLKDGEAASKLKADVVKLSHHGWSGSTRKSLLDKIMPTRYIATSEKNETKFTDLIAEPLAGVDPYKLFYTGVASGQSTVAMSDTVTLEGLTKYKQ